MELSFRWFGPADRVTLEHIRQVPGVTAIVGALYEVPTGESWTRASLEPLVDQVCASALRLSVVESVPVHEDIKLGRPTRDRWIDNYCDSIRAIGSLGISVLCYNFMPVFDWVRTDLARRFPDGSTGLAYDDVALASFDLTRGPNALPGWATAYTQSELTGLIAAYRPLTGEQLWEHLAYFVERVAPVAESCGVRLALHPDDPPWPIFGLPRIIRDGPALERVLQFSDVPANGITLCTGSLGASAANDVPDITRRIGRRKRIHFAHCRNVSVTAPGHFHETPHPSGLGDIDMYEVIRALFETGFDGPMRPDHGRMIWGESGRPGYGLYDRALGAMYLQGLWEAVQKNHAHDRLPPHLVSRRSIGDPGVP